MINTDRLPALIPAAVDVDPITLQDMVARAVAFVESQTRRYFGTPVEVTEYLSGNGSRLLRLSELAVELDSDGAVTLVEERAYPGADATVLAETDYEVRTRNGTPPQADSISMLVRRGGGVWTQGYEYAVTYGRGYEVDEGPKDIEQLIIDLVTQKLEPLGEEVMQSETIGGTSYTRFRESNVDAIEDGWTTIEAWRRAVFA